mmetsp:Transcript_11753/g.54693  ORF Transcript_11753/g.54693 Transcript_11753/m.54693 type:complete len:201 (-) Transcript_11753:3089-3691(-)
MNAETTGGTPPEPGSRTRHRPDLSVRGRTFAGFSPRVARARSESRARCTARVIWVARSRSPSLRPSTTLGALTYFMTQVTRRLPMRTKPKPRSGPGTGQFVPSSGTSTRSSGAMMRTTHSRGASGKRSGPDWRATGNPRARPSRRRANRPAETGTATDQPPWDTRRRARSWVGARSKTRGHTRPRRRHATHQPRRTGRRR